MRGLDAIAEELAGLLARATPGPVHRCEAPNGHIVSDAAHAKVYEIAIPIVSDYALGKTRYASPAERRGIMDANADLIVSLRNAAPLLLRERAALRDLEDEVRTLKDAKDRGAWMQAVARLNAKVAALDALRAEAGKEE